MKSAMKVSKSFLTLAILFFLLSPKVFGQTRELLSPEERFWLESRNNTIIVYPEKNNPPFSYTSAGGNIQGLSIDYIELVAEKVNAKVIYLLPQSRRQIISDFRQGKGDVIAGLMETNNRDEDFIFTDSYVTVPTVIVVRKDAEVRKSLTMNDFNGKQVALVADSALEEYIRENYPRVVIEDVTDDEISLQQVILGEVNAAVMDIASLSYFLSKQVLSSVKIVGSTGLDYKPAFALLAKNATLQRILEKGMTQISTSDRNLLTDKWVAVPIETVSGNVFTGFLERNVNNLTLYVLGFLFLFVVLILFLQHRRVGILHLRFQKARTMNELKEEVSELEKANDMLAEEMKVVKEEEDRLQEKIQSLDK
jgi:ABC-type amino acid transport substrate-binding protein